MLRKQNPIGDYNKDKTKRKEMSEMGLYRPSSESVDAQRKVALSSKVGLAFHDDLAQAQNGAYCSGV